jgi:DNA polymerase III epsilon subunit-like protein
MMNSHICTVSLARRLLPDLKSFRLVALAEHFAVPHPKRHRAGEDARATARVFLRLLEHLHENGVRDLDGARRFQAESRQQEGDCQTSGGGGVTH